MTHHGSFRKPLVLAVAFAAGTVVACSASAQDSAAPSVRLGPAQVAQRFATAERSGDVSALKRLTCAASRSMIVSAAGRSDAGHDGPRLLDFRAEPMGPNDAIVTNRVDVGLGTPLPGEATAMIKENGSWTACLGTAVAQLAFQQANCEDITDRTAGC